MRRLRMAVFVAAMMVLSGCGHQVTGLNEPNSGSVPSGQTLIRFETAAQPDFIDYSYLIVINTSGDGHVPYALGYNSNYADWSFAFFVGGGAGFANSPVVFQYFQDASAAGGVNKRTLGYGTGTVQFTTLSGSAGYGFNIQFNRCVLDFPSPITTGNTPTPAPTAHPAGASCPPFYFIPSQVWIMNLFSIDNTNTVVDSLGNGPSDTSAPGFTLNTAALVPGSSYIKPAGTSEPQNPSAQITGIQVFSTP